MRVALHKTPRGRTIHDVFEKPAPGIDAGQSPSGGGTQGLQPQRQVTEPFRNDRFQPLTQAPSKHR